MTDLLDEEPTTKKKRHRLKIKRIDSIGAVESADNPESWILLAKARDPGSMASGPTAKAERGRAVSGSGPALPRRPLTVAETAAVVATIKARTATIEARTAALTTLADTQRSETRMATTETARQEVERLAAEMVKSGEAPNMTHARPAVWRARPDLVQKSRTADTPGRKRDPVPGGTAPEPGSLPERIANVVDARAYEISGQAQHFTKTAAERKVAVWKSRDGQALRELYTAAMRDGGKVSKSATSEHAAAFEVLARWEADPRDGLN